MSFGARAGLAPMLSDEALREALCSLSWRFIAIGHERRWPPAAQTALADIIHGVNVLMNELARASSTPRKVNHDDNAD